jgi:hypothetical protein
MPDSVDWLIVGDFNLYRNPSDCNRPSADYSNMLMFNAAISTLGLVEIPLKGQRFTWSNKQHPPLLERLDWFFTSPSWTISYPNTNAFTLTMETSDHVPCLINISTVIPTNAGSGVCRLTLGGTALRSRGRDRREGGHATDVGFSVCRVLARAAKASAHASDTAPRLLKTQRTRLSATHAAGAFWTASVAATDARPRRDGRVY